MKPEDLARITAEEVIECLGHNAKLLVDIMDGKKPEDETVRDAILVGLCDAMVLLLRKP